MSDCVPLVAARINHSIAVSRAPDAAANYYHIASGASMMKHRVAVHTSRLTDRWDPNNPRVLCAGALIATPEKADRAAACRFRPA